MNTSRDNITVSGKRGKVLHSGERQIVWNVYNFFKKLSSPEFRESLDFNQCSKLCALAVGKSESTVSRICSTVKSAEPGVSTDAIFLSPGKTRKKKAHVLDVDKFDQDVVRRIVFSYYEKGEYPTAGKITHDLQEAIGYKGSIWSTRRLLKKLGFKYKKMCDGRKFLKERNDIVAARLKFLRTMHDLRQSNDTRPVYYLDETWVNEHHSRKYSWVDNEEKGGIKVPLGKGRRLIICHVGSKNGFVKEAKWVFQSKTKSQDYHDEMNAASFKEWFVNFLNLLDEGSIIVMDNAPYHSVQVDKIPTSKWKKAEIQEWLRKRNVDFTERETVAELSMKVLPFKKKEKIYELDVHASLMGHTVVRLPPYHCEYNPIEMIWAKVKGEIAEKNTTFRLSHVQQLTHEALDRVTKEDWESRIDHAIKVQEADYEKECKQAVNIERMLINLADSDSDSDTSEFSEVDNNGSDSEVMAT